MERYYGIFAIISVISIFTLLAWVRNTYIKLKKSRLQSNRNLSRFLQWANAHDFAVANSLSRTLTLIREEYALNDHENIDVFDVDARTFLYNFFMAQTSAQSFQHLLSKEDPYTDPKIKEIITDLVIGQKKKIIELFEKNYEEVKDAPPANQRGFIYAVRYHYFEAIKLEHHFYTRIEEMEKSMEAKVTFSKGGSNVILA
jgi:hypothetical protein